MEPESKRPTQSEIEKLSHYVEQDYTQLLDNLLIYYAFSRNEKTNALLLAIQLKKINCIAVLLRHNVNVNGSNAAKQTPLLEAVLGRQVTAVKWLLIHGAYPKHGSLLTNFNDIPSSLDCEDCDSIKPYITPLMLAGARLQSSSASNDDSRIYNLLSKSSKFCGKTIL